MLFTQIAKKVKPAKGIFKCQKKQDLQEQILMWHQMI